MKFIDLNITQFPISLKQFFYYLLININETADFIVFVYQQHYYSFGDQGIENCAIFEISYQGIIKTSQLTFSNILDHYNMGNAKDLFITSIIIES